MHAQWSPLPLLFLVSCGGATLGQDIGAADSGTHSDGGTTSHTCIAACIDSELSWAANGGLGDGANPSSSVSTCTSYVHEESSGSGDLSCTDTLSTSCSGTNLGAGALASAMDADDVKTAFAGAIPLYGNDPRGCDGTVEQITYQGKTIEVGGDCTGNQPCSPAGATCTPVPAGLRTLVTLLADLDAQEIKTPSCASVFPGR